MNLLYIIILLFHVFLSHNTVKHKKCEYKKSQNALIKIKCESSIKKIYITKGRREKCNWKQWKWLKWFDRRYAKYKVTTAIAGATAVASFAVCRYLKQVTIKSRVQITKWYLKVILSWVQFLRSLFDAHAVDEYLKWMLRCSTRWCRHHHHLHHALYTIVHFCLQCRPRWNHHSVNYFPN